MTYKEAIEMLDYITYCNDYKHCRESIAIEMAKVALEKQIPQKVEKKRWIYTQCECGYEFSKHHGDGYYSIPYNKKTKYCPDCGQALKWEDDDEDELD